jgi:hypothetical protein
MVAIARNGIGHECVDLGLASPAHGLGHPAEDRARVAVGADELDGDLGMALAAYSNAGK